MKQATEDTSVTEHIACNQCGARDTIERFPDTRAKADSVDWGAYQCTNPGYGVHPPIVECRSCGLIYTNPRYKASAINENYEAVEDPTYLAERSARALTFAHHLKAFERYTGPAEGRTLLDVGAYIGVFVEQAEKSGWDAYGLEPSVWVASVAQEAGLNVEQGLLGEVDFGAESFDAITMWDVIEHVPDPLGSMEECYRMLKPGGWFAVHTMDIDSLFARVMGKRWPWLMEMHIYYFSKTTLTTMLETAGFHVGTVKPQGRYLNLGYLITRLRPYSKLLANAVDGAADLLKLQDLPIPLNFGDLVTAFAQKPE